MAIEEKKKGFSARLPALLTALVVAAVFLALFLPARSGGKRGGASSPAAAVSDGPAGLSEEASAAGSAQAQTTTAAAASVSVSAPDPSPDPSSGPSPDPSSGGSDPPVKASSPPPAAQDGILSDAAILGNSFVEALNAYNLLPQTDCFGRVGLNVRTALTKPTLKGKVPVIDELKGKTYGRVFLVFGENELGWNSVELFLESYGKLIDEVRLRQPDARIYIESIFPVSAAVSAENVEQTNNQRIDEFNAGLQRLAAEKGVGFVDGASVMRDSDGVLPADASADGVHPKASYYKRWTAFLEEQT